MDRVVLRMLREELVAVSRRGYRRGLVAGISGNNSVRLPGTELVLIKTTGCCFGDMTVADTVLITLDGEVLDPGRRPSKEWRWHCGIYRVRPDVGAVVHLHPPVAVAYSVATVPPPLVTMPARGQLQRIDMIGIFPAGSTELAEDVTRRFGDGTLRAALMREHGSITVGPDLGIAHARTEYLEDNCRVALIAAQVIAAAPGDTLHLAEGSLAE